MTWVLQVIFWCAYRVCIKCVLSSGIPSHHEENKPLLSRLSWENPLGHAQKLQFKGGALALSSEMQVY